MASDNLLLSVESQRSRHGLGASVGSQRAWFEVRLEDRLEHQLEGRPHVRSRASTRLNRSSTRRSGSSFAHRCNLVWIRSTCTSAHSGSGHSTPVLTGDLLPSQYLHCELAAALRHVTGFPGLRTTTTAPPRPGPISRRRTCPHPTWMVGSRDQPETLPTFTTYRSKGWVPNFAPAASPRVRRSSSSWPPYRRLLAARESSTHSERVSRRAPLSGPHPPGWSRGTS